MITLSCTVFFMNTSRFNGVVLEEVAGATSGRPMLVRPRLLVLSCADQQVPRWERRERRTETFSLDLFRGDTEVRVVLGTAARAPPPLACRDFDHHTCSPMHRCRSPFRTSHRVAHSRSTIHPSVQSLGRHNACFFHDSHRPR